MIFCHGGDQSVPSRVMEPNLGAPPPEPAHDLGRVGSETIGALAHRMTKPGQTQAGRGAAISRGGGQAGDLD